MSYSTSKNIQFLKRSEIDDERWNACVDQCGLPYAYSWYLDVVVANQQWDALVYDDYRAVLPLPYNQKLLGIYQLYQPMLSQQLGVFGTNDSSIVASLVQNIPAKYRRIYLQFRAGQLSDSDQRTNLLLSLQQPYEQIRSQYSKSLRKRIRKAATEQSFQMEGDVAVLIDCYRTEIGDRLGWNSENFSRVEALIKKAIEKEKGFVARVIDTDANVNAIGFFLKSHGRIINLFGASTASGRAKFAMHFLLDEIIQHYASSEQLYFDFEGSDIPGVAAFFRSYGARQENYGIYERNTLPLWIKGLLRLRSSKKA